ncbi:hypothetical protein PAXINDRAFT_19352 [Paxillus involutus ATCC 200175]|uniref:Uncharacterized protein n=1 Tax=Paxillus involutus ATCC 200175 TaxID=664439 RepID=A0A0C9THH9_PAXIN|nr:hypothetical protein PAXINDRAFT_19352 [Paxillus involutus ATCC 200175]
MHSRNAEKCARAPPPVPSAFQPPPLQSKPLSVESALTHVSLAAEPVHPYTTPALRPSGSVHVHPNTLLEFENLLSQLRNLSISEDSQFFIAINPHIAYPLNSRPPSPSAEGIFRTPSDPVSGFSDPFSPAVPGAFAHSHSATYS